MTRFSVGLSYSGLQWVDVYADTPEQARAEAHHAASAGDFQGGEWSVEVVQLEHPDGTAEDVWTSWPPATQGAGDGNE